MDKEIVEVLAGDLDAQITEYRARVRITADIYITADRKDDLSDLVVMAIEGGLIDPENILDIEIEEVTEDMVEDRF